MHNGNSYLHHERVVDGGSGEVLSDKSIISQSATLPFMSEPDYVKMYKVEVESVFGNLVKVDLMLLNELFQMMDYENQIVLSLEAKKKICYSQKRFTGDGSPAVDSLRGSLKRLVKFGIVKKVSIGVYFMNPFITGKGQWKNINKLRYKWEFAGKTNGHAKK